MDDLGAKHIPIHVLSKLPYSRLTSKAINLTEGVLFVTYSTLTSASERVRAPTNLCATSTPVPTPDRGVLFETQFHANCPPSPADIASERVCIRSFGWPVGGGGEGTGFPPAPPHTRPVAAHTAVRRQLKKNAHTHNTLSQGFSRLKQMLQWAGDDFDGLIAFDECHKAKNLVPQRGRGPATKTGQAVLDLQMKLPSARVVYCSATGERLSREGDYEDFAGLGPADFTWASIFATQPLF